MFTFDDTNIVTIGH